MPPPRLLASAILVLAALGLAGPATVAYLRYDTAWGDVREVVVTPIGDGLARVSVLYDVAIGGHSDPQGERQGGVTWLAWGQDNGWFSPGADPVLPLAQARARADALRLAADDGEQRRIYRVFYRANDPSGSAFIQLDSGGGALAHRLGLLCMGASLLLWLPFPRRRRS